MNLKGGKNGSISEMDLLEVGFEGGQKSGILLEEAVLGIGGSQGEQETIITWLCVDEVVMVIDMTESEGRGVKRSKAIEGFGGQHKELALGAGVRSMDTGAHSSAGMQREVSCSLRVVREGVDFGSRHLNRNKGS